MSQTRARARELGIVPGVLSTGAHNAITDVEGVLVGQVTLIEGDDVRTGVTVIRPHGGNLFQQKVAGGVFVGNGFGKLAGSTQVAELGTLEAPIILTNSMSVGPGIDGGLTWTLNHPGNEKVRSVNVLVGETNDGVLNDIRARRVTEAHVVRAIEEAAAGPVEEGSVGAGTGTMCFGWKGGIGTSSRIIAEGYTVGILVQTNYGGALRLDGVLATKAPAGSAGSADGSCMLIVATDAPLLARGLQRLAARAVFGMARTGSNFSNGSGDYGVAFSTTALAGSLGTHEMALDRGLPDHQMSPLFTAVLDATEEAIYNSLFMATTVRGHEGRVGHALPLAARSTTMRSSAR